MFALWPMPPLETKLGILTPYAANRLRVVRQVRYSLHNENCLDLVLFLNCIPVATAELKTDFTQKVGDAVDQYRFDRQPRPKGQRAAEPLLSFPRGALVHFAVSNSEVRMTTDCPLPDRRSICYQARFAPARAEKPMSYLRCHLLWLSVLYSFVGLGWFNHREYPAPFQS